MKTPAKTFLKSTPCSKGHISPCYVSTGRCRACVLEETAKWQRNNPAKRAAATKRWMQKNPEVVRARDRRARGLPLPSRPDPGICERTGCTRTFRMSLDHCHITGKFRGWLCFACNTGIGKLGDTEEGLLEALNYIRVANGKERLRV